MRKIVLLPLLLMAVMAPVGMADASPTGNEDNPIGSLQWLPENTNERPPAGLSRLVVIFDRSINAAGKPSPLLVKGSFGVKIATTSPDLRMKNHSSGVGSIDEEGGSQLTPVDEVLMGVHGDVRDGACSRVGTSGFSAAFSTTRTFVHSGSTPYQPASGSGACEVVESSIPVPGGFQTRVTNYAPGFWIDVEWPETGGQILPEIWYTAVYDTEGESGDFYETSDAAGTSKSIGAPPARDAS